MNTRLIDEDKTLVIAKISLRCKLSQLLNKILDTAKFLLLWNLYKDCGNKKFL